MGCFLACFGSSKDQKRRYQRKNKVFPPDQRHGIQNARQSTFSPEQIVSAIPTLISEVPDKTEEQLSLSTRKKVTFDTKVETYEPVSVCESTELLPKSDEDIKKQKEDFLDKSSLSHSISQDGSVTSSVVSFPPNHRYQNYRESDDEAEEFECEDSDLDDDDDDDDDGEGELEEYGDFSEDENNKIVDQEVWFESVESKEAKTNGNKQNARDRSVYVHSVLNPVENLTQWKAAKSKGTPLKPHKENFKPKFDQSENRNQEISVDASLSNWLVVSCEPTTAKKTSPIGLETVTSERSMSQGLNSMVSFEDRPILGALTVEELKQFSASSSPRRSPSRSPDEMPIIGTVGTYWRHTGLAEDSGSASSYKGIPNTTSKYREDSRVKWHSTPFETRLERALKRPAAEA